MSTISPEKAQKLLSTNKAILIDVREPDEFMKEHIAYATSAPLSQIDSIFENWPFGNERTVLVQCQKGKRGEMACEFLAAKEAVTAEILNVEGGIDGWKQAALPTIISGKATAKLSVMRQVQITIGFVIVLFISLGYSGVSLGFALAGFMGAALGVAGITGWCGLAILLNKMPWNR